MTVRLSLQLADEEETKLTVHGKVNVKLYPVPRITSLEPSLGVVAGGTEILVKGENFNPGYGAISCIFGETAVEAKFVTLGSIVSCFSPVASDTESHLVNF